MIGIINPLTQELNPSAQRCLTRFFTGDFASSTVHFVNTCVKNQQIHQLFMLFINYREQDFGTWKVYCVSNVTFHAEFKYAIKIFPSPTVFAQWHFLLSIFRNFGYFLQRFFNTWTNILNWFEQTIYHYQITSCMCSEARSEWDKRWFMALGILWRFINTPVLHRHSAILKSKKEFLWVPI
jgi:hypothetical protein